MRSNQLTHRDDIPLVHDVRSQREQFVHILVDNAQPLHDGLDDGRNGHSSLDKLQQERRGMQKR